VLGGLGVRRGGPAVGPIWLALILNSSCVSHTYEDVGGGWARRWDHSSFADAGGHHPFLYRKRLFSSRVVQENCYEYRYLGDDCVIYAGLGGSDPVLVACGERRPVQVSPHLGYSTKARLQSDPMLLDGRELSVADAKARGLAEEEMFPVADLPPLIYGASVIVLLLWLRQNRAARHLSIHTADDSDAP